MGLRRSLKPLRQPASLQQLSEHGVPAVWIQSVRVLLEVVDDLERQIAAVEAELRPIARTDQRVVLLGTIPGVGELLGLTVAAEIGDISRFGSARKLIGYAGLAPTIKQSGQSSWTGRNPRPGRRRCGGRPSRPHSTPGGRPTPGTGSTPRPDNDTANQPRQDRGRAQSPNRQLARPLTSTAVQTPHTDLPRNRPRQPPRRSGRLTAQKRHEKPGQLKPIICAAKRRKRTQHPLPSATKGNPATDAALDNTRAFKEIVPAKATANQCERR